MTEHVPYVPGTRIPDMTGLTFGRWTVTKFAGRNKRRQAIWRCVCECGTETVVPGPALRHGSSKSCGCATREAASARTRVDMVGKTFGRLTVSGFEGISEGRNALWRCVCSCGARGVVVRGSSLRSGKTKSCGCLNREAAAAQGHASRTHGQTHTPLHRRWQGMLTRCHNPNDKRYADYGGRGITVCPEWRGSFEAFARDMGPTYAEGMTLDRIDVDGPYSPENCRWATQKEQQNNRRNNRLLTFRGQTKTLAEWCELLGLSYGTVWHRLKSGWPVERALTTSAETAAQPRSNQGDRP